MVYGAWRLGRPTSSAAPPQYVAAGACHGRQGTLAAGATDQSACLEPHLLKPVAWCLPWLRSPEGAALAICLSGGYADDDDHGDWCAMEQGRCGPPAVSIDWADLHAAAHLCGSLPCQSSDQLHNLPHWCRRFWYTGEGGRSAGTNEQVRRSIAPAVMPPHPALCLPAYLPAWLHAVNHCIDHMCILSPSSTPAAGQGSGVGARQCGAAHCAAARHAGARVPGGGAQRRPQAGLRLHVRLLIT